LGRGDYEDKRYGSQTHPNLRRTLTIPRSAITLALSNNIMRVIARSRFTITDDS
jgi:hypothetical protein